MTSYSGSVAYLKYVAKTDKGDIRKGDLFNGVFGLGDSSDARTAYTSQAIVETGGTQESETALKAIATGAFGAGKDIKYIDADGVATYGAATGVKATIPAGGKIVYFSNEFQMTQVPATDIPTIGPKMEHIALVAEPRRIAVRYDQITAFQA